MWGKCYWLSAIFVIFILQFWKIISEIIKKEGCWVLRHSKNHSGNSRTERINVSVPSHRSHGSLRSQSLGKKNQERLFFFKKKGDDLLQIVLEGNICCKTFVVGIGLLWSVNVQPQALWGKPPPNVNSSRSQGLWKEKTEFKTFEYSEKFARGEFQKFL